MAGFLGQAPLTSDIAFFVEVAIVILLFVGRFRFARNKRFRAHGFTVSAAVALHALTILLVMIPVLAEAVSSNVLFSDFSSPSIFITWIHAPLGLAILILGVYLVSVWRFQPPDATCFKKANLMRPLWCLWVFNFVLGLLIYISRVVSG